MGKNKGKDRRKKKGDAQLKDLDGAPQANGSPPAVPAKQAESKQQAAGPAGAAGESWKDKGNKFFGKAQYEEALEMYTKALAEDGESAVIYSNRSATYSAQRKFEHALADAERCIELQAEWAKGYMRKGDALEHLLRYAEAYETYQAGLKADPNDQALQQKLSALQKLLEELKITESQLADKAANPDSDKFDNMVRWMREGGSKFPMLYLQYYSEDYRGVHALTKVPVDTIILYVPLSHIMTSEVAKASDVGKKVITSGVELRSKHSFLACYLCQEKKNPSSFWRPYIDILPSRYRNMPIFFTEDELKWLKGSFTLEKVHDRNESLRIEYENICKAVPEFAQLATLWDFVWARLVVITRIFGLVIRGKKTDGLVPYADMLNHKRPRDGGSDTKWTFEDSMNGFIITTLRTIMRGEEVFDSYGRKCNSRFFVNYGFTLDENEDNEAVLKIALPKSDPLYAMKVAFLGGRESMVLREFQIPASYKERKTRELFSFMRFVHAKGPEMMQLPQDSTKLFATHTEDEDVEYIDPLSISNEISCLRHLAQSSEAAMSDFETTIEWDEQYLKQPREKLDNNIRNCVVMRLGEKRVLQWFVDLARDAIPLLQMPWKDLKRVAAKSYRSQEAFDYYVTTVVVPLVKKGT